MLSVNIKKLVRSSKNSTRFRIDSLFVGSFAGLTLLIGAFAVCSTFSIDSTNAVSDSKQISVNLNENINISSYPATIELTNCNPSTSNLCTANASITTSSNYELGYSLYMNATNGSPTALTNTATSPSSTIPSVTQAYSSANLPVNTWGYTGGTNKSSETGGYDCTTNYCPILAYNSNDDSYAPNRLIDSTDTATASRTKTITFGAKVNTTKPSGTYTTTVVFTAVGTPRPLAPAMQDFNTSSCAAMSIGSTTTLRDTRDNEEYLIGKLADDNCWMLDNLALGSTNLVEPLSTSNTNMSPNTSFSLPSSSAPWDTDSAAAYTTAKINTTYADTTTVNYGAGSGKIGVYYNFCATSAGTYCYDSSSGVGDAQYDICPSGWKIPTSDQYGSLHRIYNYDANTFLSKLSITMSGEIWNSAVGKQGSAANLWESTYYDAGHMLRTNYEGIDVYTGMDAPRGLGFSIRCIIK